jgi:hypothetical protein
MNFKILVIMIGLIAGPLFVYGQSGTTTTTVSATMKNEIKGKILEINQDASMIKVRSYVSGDTNSYNDYEIYVMQEAKIEVDGRVLKLSDLNSGNEVVVRYGVSEDGKKEADHIWIKIQ